MTHVGKFLSSTSARPTLPGFVVEPVNYWLHAVDRRGTRYLIESRERVFVLYPITDERKSTITVGPPGPIFPKAEVMPG